MKKTTGKLVKGSLKYPQTAKLKGVKLTLSINPLWTKQIAVIKKEIQKLNKIHAYTVS